MERFSFPNTQNVSSACNHLVTFILISELVKWPIPLLHKGHLSSYPHRVRSWLQLLLGQPSGHQQVKHMKSQTVKEIPCHLSPMMSSCTTNTSLKMQTYHKCLPARCAASSKITQHSTLSNRLLFLSTVLFLA